MITDNFRQVIEYYHSLIEKGLMPKDILTRDGSQNTADISNDGKTAKSVWSSAGTPATSAI